MSKYIVLAVLVLAIVCSLQAVDAVAGDGFCFKKINSKTGACKKSLSINGNKKSQKVDCCSSGGAGWSLKKKDKANCEHCSTSVPVTSYWGDWSSWSTCNETCGASYQFKNRTCLPEGATGCKGNSIKWRACAKPPCPIHGGWSDWGNWSRCSKTCEKGYQTQSRTCTNPIPRFGGADCQGPLEQQRECEEQVHCPIHGGWGAWGDYGACSLTCGLGKRVRKRPCDNPKPQYGGRVCNATEETDFKYCREQRCREIDFSGSGSGYGSGDGWSSGSGSGSESGSGSSGSGSGGWEGQTWNDDEDFVGRRRKRSFRKSKKD